MENIVLTLPENLPSAFACSSDYAAGFLYDRLVERGLRVPEDISISSYDDYLQYHPLSGNLTTYRVDMERMASASVDIALGQGDVAYSVSYVDDGMIIRNSAREWKKQLH